MAHRTRENKATYEYEKDGQNIKVEKPLTPEEIDRLSPGSNGGATEPNTSNEETPMDPETYSLLRLEERMTGGSVHTMKVWKESAPNEFSAYCGALAIPNEVDPENPHEAVRRRFGKGQFLVKYPAVNRQTGQLFEKSDFIIIQSAEGDPNTSINVTLPPPAVATGNPQMDGFIQYMMAQSKLEAERMREELKHEREMRREELKADRDRQERMEARMLEMQKRDPLDIGNIAKALASVREMLQPKSDPKDALIQVMVLKKLKEIGKEEGVEQGLVDKVMNNPLLAQKAGEVIDVILSRTGKAPAPGVPGSAEALPTQSAELQAENETEALRMELERFWITTVMSTAQRGGDPFTCAEFIRQRFGANVVQVVPLLGISLEAISKTPPDLSGFYQKYPNALNFKEFFNAVFFYLMNANATPLDEEDDEEEGPETEDRVQ